jgi:prepilin-type N-terminal cleavage/methylation domain-containing protein
VRRNSGFTILEIIVVLLLMTILAATVLGRSALTDPSRLDLNSATEKFRLHVRFAQAQAMKRSDTVWGIKSSGTEYWAFRNTAPDIPANEVRIPGGDYPTTANRIREADMGASISDFTVFFDRIGRPYSAYTSPAVNTPLASNLSISISAGSDTRTITVSPETGLVQ